MLLQPKRTRHKKIRKGTLPKYKFNSLQFGDLGLRALESGMVTSRQIEATRQAINRKLNRKGKIWIRVFPTTPLSKTPIGSRMGKGKGSISHWVSKVASGKILFEVCSKNIQISTIALKAGKPKLPLKTKIIKF